ncbi:uncharacterized protein LOC116139811 isoform X2 [Pistacia vera]|uniref:uncharacterized protein LOC116139811 isoform X2 n=1 Tax=Pistacia vera TaxID=55513 RepID=UPI00126319BA|nr:uncharacterized protein LOC116139811 isoform X2 [Pistacia vera]
MGSCFPLLSDLLLLDCRYRACALKWHLDRHQEPDSGPSQNLHRSPHKETLNGHSLVSLSSNRDGSSPISAFEYRWVFRSNASPRVKLMLQGCWRRPTQA